MKLKLQKMQVWEEESNLQKTRVEKVTDQQLVEMLTRHREGEGYRALARSYGLSRSTVRRRLRDRHARAILELLTQTTSQR